MIELLPFIVGLWIGIAMIFTLPIVWATDVAGSNWWETTKLGIIALAWPLWIIPWLLATIALVVKIAVNHDK